MRRTCVSAFFLYERNSSLPRAFAEHPPSDFGLRISFGFRLSDFGFPLGYRLLTIGYPMSALSFQLTRDDISPALSQLAATAKHPEPVFRAMGTTFLSLTMGNFKSADYRPTPWKEKRDGTAATLQKSGTLSRSFHLEVTARGATVGSPMIYAAIHQFGGTIKGNPKLRFQWAPGRWATVSQVTIPPRPFFPVLNDRLTPKAEEKIRASAARALARQAG
jgi:phage gpG-like protein